MDFVSFNESLSGSLPPGHINIYLQALWFEGKGNWEESHKLVQDLPDKKAAWIHAYLHRKEGDLPNAGYWYHRAGHPMPANSLSEEWETLVMTFLDM